MKKTHRYEKQEERQVMESEPQVTTSCLLLCLACSNQAESFNSWVHFHLFKMKNAQGYELLWAQLYLIIQLPDSEIGFDLRPDGRGGREAPQHQLSSCSFW